MLAAEPWGRRLRRQQTGTSALLVLRQERRACRIGALRRKGALTSACAGLPMMMIEGCEPAAGDPVASPPNVWRPRSPPVLPPR